MTDRDKLRQIQHILHQAPDCSAHYDTALPDLTPMHLVNGNAVRHFTAAEALNVRLTVATIERENSRIVDRGWPWPHSCHDQVCHFRFHGLPELHVSTDLEEVMKSSHTIRATVARGGNALDIIIALAQELRKVSDGVLGDRMAELMRDDQGLDKETDK